MQNIKNDIYGIKLINRNIYLGSKIGKIYKREDTVLHFFEDKENQESKIEGFMRSFLFRLIYGKEECIKDIYVTDLNSTDETSKILNDRGIIVCETTLDINYNIYKNLMIYKTRKYGDKIVTILKH